MHAHVSTSVYCSLHAYVWGSAPAPADEEEAALFARAKTLRSKDAAASALFLVGEMRYSIYQSIHLSI